MEDSLSSVLVSRISLSSSSLHLARHLTVPMPAGWAIHSFLIPAQLCFFGLSSVLSIPWFISERDYPGHVSAIWLLCLSLICSSVHGILQARIVEWVAISFSRGSSWPRDGIQVSNTAGRLFTNWATREVTFSPLLKSNLCFVSWMWGFATWYEPWCPPFPGSKISMPSNHLILCPLLLLPQSYLASRSFQMSQLFESGGQSIGVSASASVLPMNIQDWSPLGWTGCISLQSKGPSGIFSSTTVQKHQFCSAQLSLWSNSHNHTWLLEKP